MRLGHGHALILFLKKYKLETFFEKYMEEEADEVRIQ